MYKRSVFLFILIICFFLFQDQVMKLYDDHIVNPIISLLKPSGEITFLLVISIEATICLFIYCWQEKKKVTDAVAYLSSFLLVLYIYYRFFSARYIFYPLCDGSNGLKYSDYFILLFGALIALKIVDWLTVYKKPRNYGKPFLIDSPITNGISDKFQRRVFATQ